MSNLTIPNSINSINTQQWATFEPYYDELQNRPLTDENIAEWLQDWSKLSQLVQESYSWIRIQLSIDTTDSKLEDAFTTFVNDVLPASQRAEQRLKERLLATNYRSPEMAIPLRNMRNSAELFRDENVPLLTELAKLGQQYDKVTGAISVEWEGETKNLSQLQTYLESQDRTTREKAFRLWSDRWLQERDALNDLYGQMLEKRQTVAENAGFSDFREYSFRSMNRFAYTPEDCHIFHQAIEEAIVPAVQRILAHRQAEAGYDSLLPWEWVPEIGMLFETGKMPTLTPYNGQDELIQNSINIFHQLDPKLGSYIAQMADNGMLDLETRQGKALGGYCAYLPVRQSPFIFMNGTGQHDNVLTMLHEAGHAFHAFEAGKLPLTWQHSAPMEFCEVASMTMELLAAPYLTKEKGGFYTTRQSTQAQLQHLEGILMFFPYMAVVDGFQHWVYTHPNEAMNAGNCDDKWLELCQRFLPGIAWDGFEETRKTGWHRKLHIFHIPYYYIEYGIARLGSLQVWRNSLTNPKAALASYYDGLALGGKVTLPELFEAVGAQFRFDIELVSELVVLVERGIATLRAELG